MKANSFLSRYRGDTVQKEEPGMFNKSRSAVYAPDSVETPAQPDIAGSMMSAAGALSKANQPNAAAFGADSPAPGVMPGQESSSGWLQNKGQFIAAMGAIAQHFGQTPGQVSSGRMLMQQGAAEMEQQRKDEAAQKLGFGTAEEMTASQALADIRMKEAQRKTEEAKPGLVQSQAEALKAETDMTREKMKAVVPEIDLIRQKIKSLQTSEDTEKLQQFYQQPQILRNPFGDGVDHIVPLGEVAKFDKVVQDILTAKQAYKAGGIELDALEGLKDQTIDVMGIKVPATMLKTVMPTLTAKIQGENALAVQRLENQGKIKAAEIAAEGKDHKGFASVRKISEDYEKVISDPLSAQVYFTKNKDGKMVVKPEAKHIMESYATVGAALINSPDPGDQSRGKFMVNKAFDMQGITPKEYDMAILGKLPGRRTIETPAAPTEAAPTKPSSTLIMPPGIGKAPEVPYGATERVIGGAVKLPGTFVSEGLKAYREQQEFTRGR